MKITKRAGMMILGILFIGLCVSFLRLSGFGVDPFSAMNLGISGFIGWSFGTWQLLMNAVILVIVFFQARQCIGAGTIINMIFVGYIADFVCWLAQDVVQIEMSLPLRIIALALAQLMASMGVALYMVADMGIAPYDAFGVIIEKISNRKIPFKAARVLTDVICVAIGFSFGSIVGVATIITAFCMGPLIEVFRVQCMEKLVIKYGN